MTHTRAQIREQRRRHARRWAKIIQTWWCYDTMSDAEIQEEIHRRVTTRKPCSCAMCGNPRRWFGERPVQERRELERALYDSTEQ